MSKLWQHPLRAISGFVVGAVLVGAAMFTVPSGQGQAQPPSAAPPATPVSVAVVEQREVACGTSSPAAWRRSSASRFARALPAPSRPCISAKARWSRQGIC